MRQGYDYPPGAGGGSTTGWAIGSETVNTGPTPKTLSVLVYVSLIVTDGTATQQEIDFPFPSGTPDDGAIHLVSVTLTDPGDSVLIGGLVAESHTYTVSGFGVYRATSGGWQMVDSSGTGIVFASNPEGVFERQASGDTIFVTDPALQFSETLTTTNLSTTTTNGSTLTTIINSSGSGGEEDLAVHAADFQIGQRKLIVFQTQANPADFIFISSANIRLSGAAPSLIQLNVSGDQLLLEWTVDSATNAHFWNVLQFTTGVVTP